MSNGNEIPNKMRSFASGQARFWFREVDEYRDEHLWRQSIDLRDGCVNGGRLGGDRNILDSANQAVLRFESQAGILAAAQRRGVPILGNFSLNQRTYGHPKVQ